MRNQESGASKVHKVSMIEKLGLSDPDGTNFDQNVINKVQPHISSYKYLKNKFREVDVQSKQKRDFVKEVAKA